MHTDTCVESTVKRIKIAVNICSATYRVCSLEYTLVKGKQEARTFSNLNTCVGTCLLNLSVKPVSIYHLVVIADPPLDSTKN